MLRSLALTAIVALAGCASASSQRALPASPSTTDAAATHESAASAGASFVYTGTLQQSGSSGHATLAVTQHITESQTMLNGRTVVVYHGVETTTGKGTSLTATFDADVAAVPSKTRTGTDVDLLELESSDSAGIKQTTVYGAGNGTYDQLPEVPQARWSNTATRTVSIANAVAGSTLDDRYQADGSYEEHAVPVEGRTASSQSYPDGYATYQFPYQGGTNNSTIAFSPPAGGKLQILFTNFLLHITQLYTMNDWYPASPVPLASDAYRNAGTVAIPSACKVPKRYGKTATQIVEQIERLDIVFGQYETTQRTTYVTAPYGLVCTTVHDQLQTYYDYNAGALSDKPLTTVVIDETIGLQHAQLPKGSAAEAASVALPLDSAVASMQAARRLKAERAIFNALQHLRKKQ
jgi:hypothetical protein